MLAYVDLIPSFRDDPCHQLTQMATHLVKRRIGSGPAAPRQQPPATALAQAPELCSDRAA